MYGNISTAPDHVRELRLTLLANDYEPVAVAGKAPVSSGWQSRGPTADSVAAEIDNFPEALNTGLRTGGLVGVDIDLLDPEEAASAQALAEQELGPTPFVRVGQKGMLLCYANAEPLRKITVASRDGAKVEILGVGQQFVAYGDHPATGEPYRWTGSAEPAASAAWELPPVSPDQIRALADRLANWLRERHADVKVSGDMGRSPAEAVQVLPHRNLPPLPPEEIRARLYACDPDCERDQWRNLIAALRATPCSDPEFDACALAEQWSTTASRDFGDDPAQAAHRVFETMPPRHGGLRSGSFIRMTDDAGYSGPTVAHSGSPIPANGQPYPRPKSAAELAFGDFPRPAFAWDRFILQRHVNLLYGDGGTGKTLLAEHIACAVAAGRELFGFETVQMPVLLVLAEDDDGETKARLEAICRALGLNLPDLPLSIWCLPGWDLNLAHIRDDGSYTGGPFMEPLRAELERIGPCLLILDTVTDIAALDETKRPPVNALCKVILAGLCREFGATVLVNAHPSKAAMADGSDYAGSTAWNNAVRNRLSFKRPDAKSRRRLLEVAKANYGEPTELELYLIGPALVTMAEIAEDRASEREAVWEVVRDLIAAGVDIVRGNGAGQKPRDVAEAIHERLSIRLDAKQVLDHLNALERAGRLAYEKGGNGKRGQRAGFRLP